MYDLLKAPKQAAMNDVHGQVQAAQMHHVAIGSDVHRNAHEMNVAKESLREWVRTLLGWTRLIPGISDGFWRSIQVLVSEAGFHALLREREKRLMSLKESGCDFYFSGELEGGSRLASIVGKRDKVYYAGTKAVESW
jgi:hypothetical protein